jgi:DNA helicase-2/ATP-dependent DNA helicase PcrA
MILWVIEAFKTSPEILSRYQEQFLYTLVDEFQDTNGSQKEILDLLTSFWEEPNIFVV